MIDTRAVAQEVQDQLLTAFQKGHEQVRKGRDAATVAVRTGNQLAKAVMPSLPALPRPDLHLQPVSPDKVRAHAHELAGQMLTRQRKFADNAQELAGQMLTRQRKFADNAQELASQMLTRQRKFADNAQELAGQVLATQRKLAGAAIEVASPLVAEGMTRLTQVAGSLSASRRGEHAEPHPRSEVTAASTGEAPAQASPTAARTAARAKATAAKPSTAKARASAKGSDTARKPRTAKK